VNEDYQPGTEIHLTSPWPMQMTYMAQNRPLWRLTSTFGTTHS